MYACVYVYGAHLCYIHCCLQTMTLKFTLLKHLGCSFSFEKITETHNSKFNRSNGGLINAMAYIAYTHGQSLQSDSIQSIICLPACLPVCLHVCFAQLDTLFMILYSTYYSINGQCENEISTWVCISAISRSISFVAVDFWKNVSKEVNEIPWNLTC